MTSESAKGHGLQVLSPLEDHTFQLDEEALQKLLLQEDVADRAVVLVSVAGAYRKGKSFLLDFFLRYLYRTYKSDGKATEGDWISTGSETLEGFPWRGGSDRHTSGIHLWSEPFKTTLPNGQRVVILLMDTQGTFDSESTVKDNATVFALSTMLSSVLIYNLSGNIEEDDLQHLQLFMEYGRVAMEDSGHTPFQHLEFLVRDWPYPYDYAYGAEGGKLLLKKRLTIHESQHSELQRVRSDIARCFEHVSCFLLPHPGFKVSSNPHFNGNIADIEGEFLKHLSTLVPAVLSPQQLVVKRIAGQTVKARDLLYYFKSYVNVFSSEELPNPMTILQATAEANNTSASLEARSVYESLMDEVCGGTRPYLQPAALDAEHQRCLNKALHTFDTKKKMGGEDMANKFRDTLVADLEDVYQQLQQHNESKNLYRMFGTPLVFFAVLVLGCVVSMLGSSTSFSLLSSLGQALTVGSAVMLAIWVYTRMTGNMREVGMKLDEIANTIRFYFETQTGAMREPLKQS